MRHSVRVLVRKNLHTQTHTRTSERTKERPLSGGRHEKRSFPVVRNRTRAPGGRAAAAREVVEGRRLGGGHGLTARNATSAVPRRRVRPGRPYAAAAVAPRNGVYTYIFCSRGLQHNKRVSASRPGPRFKCADHFLTSRQTRLCDCTPFARTHTERSRVQ